MHGILYLFIFLFYDGSYMFRQNNAILREQLCSFLTHLNVSMVGCNSDYRVMHKSFNPLTPKGHYSGRTASLTSRRCILNIYSTNIHTEYFKHAA
jgi:hypothetical protein